MDQTGASPIDAALPRAAPRFSVCTLVNDHAQYRAMVASFCARGFTPDDCEFLYLDNSDGTFWDAYRGIPRLVAMSRAPHVILCHQDVRLISDDADALAARLGELDALDPAWALAGNAGGTDAGELAVRISDPYGDDQRRGELPARAVSLDENFIVLKRDAPVGLSADLWGFHFYGADLCILARLAGRSAWVIDFHLRHLSPGTKDAGFKAAQARFEAKYRALFALPWRIRTTCARLRLKRGWLGR
ncbi:MAG: acyl esterase [Pseudomonadota bacterium]